MNASQPSQRRSRWPLRFSLRTLVLFVLLIGSLAALYQKWPAWVLERTLTYFGYIHSADFSPDGQRIVTAGSNYYIGYGERLPKVKCVVWEIAGQKVLVRIEGHNDYISSAKFSRDGLYVVTASRDGTARVWDAVSGREILKFAHEKDKLGSNVQVNRAAFSPDGSLIVTSSCDDNTARVWTAAGERRITVPGSDTIFSVSFSPNGLLIVTAEHGLARVWDIATGKPLTTFDGHTHSVLSAVFSPDGKRVVTASADTVRIWDTVSGNELMKLVGHTERVNTAVFSPDGKRVLTAGEHEGARIWDATSGKELAAFRAEKLGRSATYSPDGKRLVITGGEIAYVWRNQHPEYWWGFMTLAEFWLTVGFVGATIWSLKSDWRSGLSI